jgi:hypothetical protein
MENQSIDLQSQIQKSVKERKEIDNKMTELLDILDEVRICVFYLSFSNGNDRNVYPAY